MAPRTENVEINIRARDFLSQAMARINQSLKASVTHATSVGAAWNRMGALMNGALIAGAAVTAAMGAGMTRAVRAAAEFQSATSNMARVTERDLGQIREEILALPAAFGDRTQLMRGYYQVMSAGVTDSVQALDLLSVAAMDAQVLEIEQGEVVKALTKFMQGYSGEIANATEASNLLYRMERLGQTTFQELVPEIGSAAAISKELTVSQFELGGAVSQLTLTAGSTSEAFTQYRAIIAGLLKPTSRMTELLQSMGYASGQALVEERGFVGALQAIKAAAEASGLGLGKYFESIEALTGMAALASNNFQDVAKRTQEMGKAGDETTDAYERWKNDFGGIKAEWDATVGRLMIDFGNKLLPKVMQGMKDLTGWVNTHQGEIEAFFDSATTAAGFFADNIVRITTLLGAMVKAMQGELFQDFGGTNVSIGSAGGLRNERASLQDQLQDLQRAQGLAAEMGAGWGPLRGGESTMQSVYFEHAIKATEARIDQLTARIREDQLAATTARVETWKLLSSPAGQERLAQSAALRPDRWLSHGAEATRPRFSNWTGQRTQTTETATPEPESGGAPSSGGGGGAARSDPNSFWNRQQEAMQDFQRAYADFQEEKLRVTEDFAQEYTRTVLGQYAAERAELERQRAEYEQFGVDHVALTTWYTQQAAEITRREAEEFRQAQEDKLQASREFSDGAYLYLRDYADAATNAAQGAEGVFSTMFGGMESALDQYVKTSKIEWNDLALSMLADIGKIAAQQGILGPLAATMQDIFDSGGYSGDNQWFSSGGGSGGIGGIFSSIISLFSAKGNVLSGPGISALSGGIYDRPTVFGFNRHLTAFAQGGAVGELGEAGIEGVLPLARVGGKLGVHAQMGGQAQGKDTETATAIRELREAIKGVGNVRVVNSLDPAIVGNFLSSSAGEKVILNVIRRNPQILRS